MAQSSTERQRRYRERHLGPGGTKARLDLVISGETMAQLKRLARHRGCDMSDVIEATVAAAERAVLHNLTPTQKRKYLA